MAEQLARDWRTRPAAREVTVITVRVEHQLPEPATVRVSRDGPGGYRSESKVAPPYGAVALLCEEETGG